MKLATNGSSYGCLYLLICAGLLAVYSFTRIMNVHGTSEFDFIVLIAGIFGVLAAVSFARERKTPPHAGNGDSKK